jgi:RND family efflux transporter MFP subunit
MNLETNFARHAETVDMSDDETELAARRRKRIILIGVVAAIVIAFAAFRFFGGSSDKAAADAAAEDSKQVPHVTVVVPGTRMVESTISATGSLAARREMPVGSAGEGGMVSRVLVDAGDWVAQGQVLASIDRQVQVQQSAALGAQIRVAEANARLAQNELDRAKTLADRGFISKADIDRKTAQRDSAFAQLNVARAQYGENSARIGRLDIRAPAAGLILARNVEPGQVVGGGGTVLFRIAKGGEMELRAQLAEADLAKLSVGKSANVTPVGTTTSFTGNIWQMPPVIDPASRQGLVRIALAYNPAIRPGGFASASIKSGAAQVPLLPESAVQSDEKGNFAFIITKDKKVERRDVKVGDVSDAGITILSGLSGNEQVVLTAGAFLNPGETVVPIRQKSN